MGSLYELMPDAGQVLMSEPGELAYVLLEHVKSQQEDSGTDVVSQYNTLLEAKFREYPAEQREAVMRAFAEAWAWLEQERLISQAPGHDKGWFFITRKGLELREPADFEMRGQTTKLPLEDMHPRIAVKVRSPFLRGEYDQAVLQAFKEVEVAVREAAGLRPRAVGVQLMRDAFHWETGVLADGSQPVAEREATSHLFAGAIGLFKNPQSHRNVLLDNPWEVAEMIGLASLLMRIVDARSLASEGEAAAPE